MFPEYRDLISRLKTQHLRFQLLFEKHNGFDHEVIRLEGKDGHGYGQDVAKLKKEKLQTKEAVYQILLEESSKL